MSFFAGTLSVFGSSKAIRVVHSLSGREVCSLVLTADGAASSNPRLTEFRDRNWLDPNYTDMLDAALRHAVQHKPSIPCVPLLAHAFIVELRKALTAGQFAAVVRRNKNSNDPGCCHSHDFCDANMVMAGAMESIGLNFDFTNEDSALWNAAWDHAKRRMSAMADMGL
jgi:hypothetical protein